MMASKKKTLFRMISSAAISVFGSVLLPFTSFAALPPVSSNVKPDDFDNLDIGSTVGWIIGFTLWVLRVAGVVCIIWGVYGFVVSRKDGDADGINMGILKFGIGLVLTCMPSILKAAQIII